MKNIDSMIPIIILVIFFILLSISCEDDNTDLVIDSTKGFCIKIADSTVLDYSEIDFYDFSTHFIYLKNSKSLFNGTNWSTFTVFADNIKIYYGQKYPLYSSYFPTGPVIPGAPSFYGDCILPIGFGYIKWENNGSKELKIVINQDSLLFYFQ